VVSVTPKKNHHRRARDLLNNTYFFGFQHWFSVTDKSGRGVFVPTIRRKAICPISHQTNCNCEKAGSNRKSSSNEGLLPFTALPADQIYTVRSLFLTWSVVVVDAMIDFDAAF